MKKLLFAMALIAMPVVPYAVLAPSAYAAVTVSELGDLSALRTIASDSLDLTNKGDLAGAATRITDFESAWDADTTRLRGLNAGKWDTIDAAADNAISALRTAQPAPDGVVAALNGLIAALDNPVAPLTTGAATATTDASGHPLPCEDLLADLRATAAAVTAKDADKATLADLQNKGIERCNADDDKRADDFFAQALALLGK